MKLTSVHAEGCGSGGGVQRRGWRKGQRKGHPKDLHIDENLVIQLCSSYQANVVQKLKRTAYGKMAGNGSTTQ